MEGYYDIIGDVHGCAAELEALLGDLGYVDTNGAYTHPTRQAVFVGDLIDRGPEQLRVLEIVKAMVDAGTAQIVMGNHEFNAICFDTEYPYGSGDHLRKHTEKNLNQHHAFLDQVTGERRAHYIEWFTSIPLWLDLDGIRVVHACWHGPSMDVVRQASGSNHLTSVDLFRRASDQNDPLYSAVETLLKGPEVTLTDFDQPPYLDKDGHPRSAARLGWWNSEATTLRDLAVIDPTMTAEDGTAYPELPAVEVPADVRSYVYAGESPVFYGHYWRRGRPQKGVDWTDRTACVDFSAVKGGNLTAYRWSGEKDLVAENFVP